MSTHHLYVWSAREKRVCNCSWSTWKLTSFTMDANRLESKTCILVCSLPWTHCNRWTPKGWLFIIEYNFGINTYVKLATSFMISFLLLFEIYLNLMFLWDDEIAWNHSLFLASLLAYVLCLWLRMGTWQVRCSLQLKNLVASFSLQPSWFTLWTLFHIETLKQF